MHGGAGDDVVVLGVAVAQTAVDLAETVEDGGDDRVAGVRDLAVAHDEARLQDDGLLEAELPDALLHAVLHLRVRPLRREPRPRARRGDEAESVDARGARGLGDLDVHCRWGRAGSARRIYAFTLPASTLPLLPTRWRKKKSHSQS